MSLIARRLIRASGFCRMKMIFIHPMWDSENQRLGLKSCTPLGYTLVGIGNLGGMLGLLTLIAVSVYLVYRQVVGEFSSRLLWFLLIPVGLGVIGRVIFEAGWMLAIRKQFYYDDTRTAWWNERGAVRSFPPKREAT